MKKRIKRFTFLLMFVATASQAGGIVLDIVQERAFGQNLRVNAKVVQLSDRTQQIVSRLGGHLEAYRVKPGQSVEKGDAIATIKSLELSRMSAEYLAASQKLAAAKERLATTRRLYEKGLASRQEVAAERMALANVRSRRDTLAEQLRSLGLRPESLTKPTDTLTVRAHAPGTVSQLLVPSHANIGSETPIVALTQKRGYYAVAYLSVDDAMKLPKTLAGTLTLGGKTHPCFFVTLLPRVDETTQRAQALFAVEEHANLLLDAYGEMALSLPPYQKAPAVKRSALTMWESEWVLFVPNPEAHDHEEEAHKEEAHDEHGGEEAAGHDEHGHETPPYLPRVVRIVAEEGDLVAVEGIAPGETYVSDGVWYVKSLLLKERMGEHGH